MTYEPKMIIVKTQEELIKNKINELKFDNVRARAQMKLLNSIMFKMEEGCSLIELKKWMKEDALYYERVMYNIRDFLIEFRKKNKNSFSYEEIKTIRKQILNGEQL
jgi:hypothetical protein